jgi:hypothetical protein
VRLLDEGRTVDDLVLVWTWRCMSRHKRAVWLRDGGYTWSTIAAHFDEYRGLARPRLNGSAHGPAPPVPDIDALYAEARRRHPCPEPCTEDQRHEWIAELHPIVADIRAELARGNPTAPSG